MLEHYDLLQDRFTSEGRHLVLENRNRRHRLLITPPYSGGSGYFIPRDPWFRNRLAAAEAFEMSSAPTGRAKSHTVFYPTAYQTHRLTLLLNILDAMRRPVKDFTTMRDIAQKIIYRDADFGRAIEWKSSSHRRQTQRLINEARHLVNGGYRLLLKGTMQHQRFVGDVQTK